MTLAEVGRGQSVGQILEDLESPRLDEAVEDDFVRAVRRNLRRHRQASNDRLAQRRLDRAAERAAAQTHPIFGDDDHFDADEWSRVVD